MRGQIRESDRRLSDADDQRSAKHDESGNREHFDHCEPRFHRAEHFHVRRVHHQHERRRTNDPYPRRNFGEPVSEIEADGCDLGPDRNGLRKPIRHPYRESGPWAEVFLGIYSERPGNRINAGHFSERITHDHRNKCAEDVADQNAGSRNSDRCGAPEEQSHTDRAANGNHRKLPACELSVESFLPIDRAHELRASRNPSISSLVL